MAKRKSINYPGFKHQNPIPNASRIANIVMSSVIGGRDPQTGATPPDLAGQVVNVFNTHYLLAYNTAIVPCSGAGCPLDANGLPTTFTKGPAFGTARSAADYQVARTFTLSAGIRF